MFGWLLEEEQHASSWCTWYKMIRSWNFIDNNILASEKKRRKKMKLPLLHVQLSFSFLRTITWNFKIIIWQVPATLLFIYQDFIEAIYKRENNPSEQRAQSHNIRLVLNFMRKPGKYCAIKHISCEKPKQNKPIWKPSLVF